MAKRAKASKVNVKAVPRPKVKSGGAMMAATGNPMAPMVAAAPRRGGGRKRG